jgi:SAM-dependent methyltransferase
VGFGDRVVERVREQFGQPSGLGGRIAGRVMATRSSNRKRNEWVVSLLDVQPADRVLEVGFGPGLAIRELSARATGGYVCGIDHSEVMLRQASAHNAEAIQAGRVDLRLGSVSHLPAFDAPFDNVMAVNAIQFWDEPVDRLTDLRALLRPGGRIAIAFQPRGPGATDEASARKGEEIASALTEAGFSNVRVESLALKPAVACALGDAP